MTGTLSVIVPVHDEGGLIGQMAMALLKDLPDAAEIVFVCNGCRDDSAEQLRSIAGARATILELPRPNKARAIAEGERHVGAFPRFYVDSDVMITGRAIVALADVLARGDLDLVSPRTRFDVSGATWPARAVSAVRLVLPHASKGAFHGVLGVSARGRSAWGAMPDVMSDDGFIDAHIDPARKAIVGSVEVVGRPPRTLRSFIKVRARWLTGERELASLGIRPPRIEGQKRALARLARSQGPVPIMLYLFARLAAQLLALRPGHPRWYRDESSRRG